MKIKIKLTPWIYIFLTGAILGYLLFPFIVEHIIGAMHEVGKRIDEDSTAIELFFLYLVKNGSVVLLCYYTGKYLRGLIPGYICLTNGFVIGVLGFIIADTSSLLIFILCILPHGIFEFCALFQSCSIGTDKNKKFSDLSFPLLLLFLAAIIESTISPLIIKALIG